MKSASHFKVRPRAIAFVFAMVARAVAMLQISGCSNGPDKDVADDASVSPAKLFTPEQVWHAPDTATIPKNEEGKQIWYGRALVIHTSKYFGPNGSLSKITNGM